MILDAVAREKVGVKQDLSLEVAMLPEVMESHQTSV
jgi:hypothetical protein